MVALRVVVVTRVVRALVFLLSRLADWCVSRCDPQTGCDTHQLGTPHWHRFFSAAGSSFNPLQYEKCKSEGHAISGGRKLFLFWADTIFLCGTIPWLHLPLLLLLHPRWGFPPFALDEWLCGLCVEGWKHPPPFSVAGSIPLRFASDGLYFQVFFFFFIQLPFCYRSASLDHWVGLFRVAKVETNKSQAAVWVRLIVATRSCSLCRPLAILQLMDVKYAEIKSEASEIMCWT